MRKDNDQRKHERFIGEMTNNQIESVIDFSKYVSERTQNFTGREWVFQAINDWLADPEAPRFFLITGEPGSGKTAIASRLYQFSKREIVPAPTLVCFRKHFLSAVHFCHARDSNWISPYTFTKSLSSQLAKHTAFAEALIENSGDKQYRLDVEQRNITAQQVVAIMIGNLNLGEIAPVDAFNRYIRTPLQALYNKNPSEQFVILVDGLDESLLTRDNVNIAYLLTEMEYLPANVKFILTFVPDTDTKRRLQRYSPKPKEISLSTAEGLTYSRIDIKRYILDTLAARPGLTKKLHTDISQDSFAATVQDKSDNNFLYLKYLFAMLQEEQTEKITTETLEKLPNGLDEVYIEFLERLVDKDKRVYHDEYAPILGILAVAQEPMTENTIAEIVQAKNIKVRTILTSSLSHFLDVDESLPITKRVYSIYHRSFSDFLLDADRSEDYQCGYEKDLHRRVVQSYHAQNQSWNKVDWSKVDDYGLHHLVKHLYELSDVKVDKTSTYRQDLYEIISKPFMQEKLVRFGSYQSFADDVRLVMMAADAEDPPNLVQMIRGSFVYSSLRSLATDVAPETLAALAQLGQFERARGYADLIQDAEKRSQAYRLIAEALLARGERSPAHLMLKQALKSANLIDPIERNHKKAIVLSELTQTLLNAGEQECAIDVAEQAAVAAEQTYFEYVKANVLLKAAHACVLTKRFERAQELAIRATAIETNTEYKDRKAAELFRTAIILESTGNHDKAVNIEEEAWAKILEIIEAHKKGKHIFLGHSLELVKSLIELGNFVIDREIAVEYFDWADRIANGQRFLDWDKSTALSQLSLALINKGMKSQAVDAARRAVEALAYESFYAFENKNEAIVNVVTALASLQNFDKALEIAEAEEDAETKSAALGSIAQALISTAKFDKATEILNRALASTDIRLRNIPVKLSMLSSITQALAEAGMIEPAVEVAQTTVEVAKNLSDEDRNKTDNLNMIVQAFSAVQDFEQCLKVAEFIKDNRKKAEILNNIASIFAERGMKERTVEVAQRIIKLSREDHKQAAMLGSEVSEQAAMLGKMAKMLSDQGVKEEAIELANEVVKIAEAIEKPIWGTSDQSNVTIALSASAQALARTGQFDKAIEVVELITAEVDPSPWATCRRAETLKVLVDELIEAAMIDRAVEVANKMVELVKNDAFEDRRRYAHPDVSRVEVLIIVAQTLFAVGSSSKATEFTNQAFTIIEAAMKINMEKRRL